MGGNASIRAVRRALYSRLIDFTDERRAWRLRAAICDQRRQSAGAGEGAAGSAPDIDWCKAKSALVLALACKHVHWF
jgi:hypothetical protein